MEKEMEYKNKNETPNNVGVTDEIGVDLLKSQLQSFYDEKSAFEQGLENAEKNLENFSKQWEIDKKIYQLQLDNWGMAEDKKSHKVHFIEEFWELTKEQFYYNKVRPDTFQSEKMIEGYEQEIETAKKRLSVIAEEILGVKKQLTDLGEEIPEPVSKE